MMCLGNERRNAREDCGANGQRGGRELPYGAVGMEMESRHLSVARIAEVFRLCWMIFAGLTNLFNLIFFFEWPGAREDWPVGSLLSFGLWSSSSSSRVT
jgi:hypothetical protein